MIRQKLQWNNCQYRRKTIERRPHFDNIRGEILQLLRAVSGSDGDDRSFSGFHLFDVIYIFREHGIVRSDENRRKIGPDEGDDSVLELGARMSFGEKVSDFL